MFFPVNGDPYYDNVVLLLPMTGANNGTTFTEYSPSPKTITRYNAITSTTQSKWGQGSGYFDGNGDYLTSTYNDQFNLHNTDFTIETWVYRAASSVMHYVLSFRTDSPSTGWEYRINANNKPMFFYTGGSVLESSGTVSSGQWVHLAAVRSGTTVTHYINGVSAGSATFSNGTANTTGLLRVGIGSDNTNGMNGYIQDVRITKGIARYTADFAGPSGPLPYRLPELSVRRSMMQPNAFHQIARLGL